MRGYGCTSNALTILAMPYVHAVGRTRTGDTDTDATAGSPPKTAKPAIGWNMVALARLRVTGAVCADIAVVTVYGREDARPLPGARVVGALALRGATQIVGAEVVVLAHNAITRVLSAHAVYTDAGNAVPVAVKRKCSPKTVSTGSRGAETMGGWMRREIEPKHCA